MTLKQLDKELSKLDTISDRLNLLGRYHLKITGQLVNSSNGHKYKGKLPVDELVKRVSDSHFPNRSQNPEFTLWFLKWNAQKHLDNIILNDEYERKLNSNRKAEAKKSSVELRSNIYPPSVAATIAQLHLLPFFDKVLLMSN